MIPKIQENKNKCGRGIIHNIVMIPMKLPKIKKTVITSKTKKELGDYEEFIQKLLVNRDIKTKIEAEKFLYPDYNRDTHDPFLMLNMEKGVERIFTAIDKEEKIVVYADYDCDGIPGGVVLYDLFKKIDYKNVDIYIPHRHNEGYGLNKKAIKQFSDNKTKLIITVDCGITDVEEIEYANELGIDTIITDHHLPQEKLPPAYTIIDPKQKKDKYPDKELCGCGIVFKLSQGILNKGKNNGLFKDIPDGWEKWLLDMVGISTVADMVSLKKENRVLAYFGLVVLRKSKRLGLNSLFKKIGTNKMHITEDDIGFMIGPRINSAGRMGHPIDAFRLLSADSQDEADESAKYLHQLNEYRKKLVAITVKEARFMIKKREIGEVIVVGNPKWQPGILGLIASKLADEHNKPSFVWGKGQTKDIKGSCRSNGKVNVVELMRGVEKDFFINVGGHEFSGGFSISNKNIHHLEEELVRSYEKNKHKEIESRDVFVDTELSLSDVNWDTYKKIEQFAPFGIDNPKPVFLFKNIKIKTAICFGKGKNHLKLTFNKQNGYDLEAISFFTDLNGFEGIVLEDDKNIDMVGSIEKSVFRGRLELRLKIQHIAPVEKEKKNTLKSELI